VDKIAGDPAKCAARVGIAKTTVEVAAIVREEIHDALNELSRHGDDKGEPDTPSAAA
jgi:hypothetical protein